MIRLTCPVPGKENSHIATIFIRSKKYYCKKVALFFEGLLPYIFPQATTKWRQHRYILAIPRVQQLHYSVHCKYVIPAASCVIKFAKFSYKSINRFPKSRHACTHKLTQARTQARTHTSPQHTHTQYNILKSLLFLQPDFKFLSHLIFANSLGISCLSFSCNQMENLQIARREQQCGLKRRAVIDLGKDIELILRQYCCRTQDKNMTAVQIFSFLSSVWWR